jgi:DNA-directed RNA polymerase specialized sigma subunit
MTQYYELSCLPVCGGGKGWEDLNLLFQTDVSEYKPIDKGTSLLMLTANTWKPTLTKRIARISAGRQPIDRRDMTLDEMLEVMTPKQQIAVILLTQGYTQEEVAEMLGVKKAAICRIVQRASKRLSVYG